MPVLKGILFGNEDATIDISSLSNGAYFLKIGDGSKMTYKFLKNHSR